MAPATYEEVLRDAKQLTPLDRLRLLKEMAEEMLNQSDEIATLLRQRQNLLAANSDPAAVAVVVHQQAEQPSHRSTLELRGLGKELWRGIDSTEYLKQEREAWDG